MPGRDGTGPIGNRSASVRGTGNRGSSDGYCSCSKCGEKLVHKMGVPCNTIKCSKCGSLMTRDR